MEGLTVAENLCLGQWPRRNGMIDYLQMAQDAQRCLQALGVDVSPEQLVSTLSPAQKQLVEIARVMKGEPRVVILDEPTSSLASAEVELVISAVKKMSALGVAVIYVSHRMEEIRRIASCATVMRDGQVAGDVMLENTSTHHIVSLMLGRDHVDIAPVALRKLWIRPCWKSVHYAISPSWRISALRYVAAKCLALLACWGQGAVNC